jgi:F-type H+-transporting ATPase subunit b
MFSDPQFWVAIAFFAFIAAVFNPVRKILTTNLDAQIKDIKDKIEEAENLKNETQVTLSEVKKRQNDVQIEIQDIHKEAEKKVKQLEENTESKLKDQIAKRQVLAEAKIDQLTRDANNIIQSHISSTVIAATIAILKQKLNKQEQQKLIDKSIEELGSALKN